MKSYIELAADAVNALAIDINNASFVRAKQIANYSRLVITNVPWIGANVRIESFSKSIILHNDNASDGNLTVLVGTTSLVLVPGDTAYVQMDGTPNGMQVLAPPSTSNTAESSSTGEGAGSVGPKGDKGDEGDKGDKGDPGVAGATGAAGVAGAKGDVGPAGVKGDTGAAGVAGPKGDVGATGAVGPAGTDGATGAKGDTGAVGAIGPTGATGVAGAIGPTGATGAAGVAGPTGATGQVGAIGPKGDTGAAGATGATGATGAAGASATNTSEPSLSQLYLSKLMGGPLAYVEGIADPYYNNNYVDTTNSNTTVPAGGTGISAGANTPNAAMTANNAPTGYTANATNTYTGLSAYYAYDLGANEWAGANTAPNSLYQTTPQPRVETSYTIKARASTAAQSPTSWTRWGSNDGGATQTVLDTQTNVAVWANGESRTYVINNTKAYSTYGCTFTAGGSSGYYGLNELTSNKQANANTSSNITVQSTAIVLAANPTNGYLSFRLNQTGGVINVNTNVTAQISRDNGVTWINVVLTATVLASGGDTYFTGSAPFGSAPAGTSFKYKITANISGATAINITGTVATAI